MPDSIKSYLECIGTMRLRPSLNAQLGMDFMRTKIIKSLVKIANELDANGFHKQAEEVDKATLEFAASDLEDPKETWEFTAEDLMSPQEKAHAQHLKGIEKKDTANDPQSAAAQLSQSIIEDRRMKAIESALPLAVKQKREELLRKFKSVAVGSGATEAEARADAKKNMAKLAPGKTPVKMEAVSEGGRMHVILAG